MCVRKGVCRIKGLNDAFLFGNLISSVSIVRSYSSRNQIKIHSRFVQWNQRSFNTKEAPWNQRGFNTKEAIDEWLPITIKTFHWNHNRMEKAIDEWLPITSSRNAKWWSRPVWSMGEMQAVNLTGASDFIGILEVCYLGERFRSNATSPHEHGSD